MNCLIYAFVLEHPGHVTTRLEVLNFCRVVLHILYGSCDSFAIAEARAGKVCDGALLYQISGIAGLLSQMWEFYPGHAVLGQYRTVSPSNDLPHVHRTESTWLSVLNKAGVHPTVLLFARAKNDSFLLEQGQISSS